MQELTISSITPDETEGVYITTEGGTLKTGDVLRVGEQETTVYSVDKQGVAFLRDVVPDHIRIGMSIAYLRNDDGGLHFDSPDDLLS